MKNKKFSMASIGLVCILLLTSACFKNEVVGYATQINLPLVIIPKLSALGPRMDEQERQFIDGLSKYPENAQLKLAELTNDKKIDTNEIYFLNNVLPRYTLAEQEKLIDVVATDSQVSDYENKGLAYFADFSADVRNRLVSFGLNDDVLRWLSYLSDLADKDFARYALENKLCIENHKITDLEKAFLSDPDTHKKTLFDYYISQINHPELVAELMKLPEFEQIDVKDVEAIEDIASLGRYETIFGISLESMLNEGIKDKRKYCTPIQAWVWNQYLNDNEEMNEQPWALLEVKHAILSSVEDYWVKENLESSKFTSDTWQGFNQGFEFIEELMKLPELKQVDVKKIQSMMDNIASIKGIDSIKYIDDLISYGEILGITPESLHAALEDGRHSVARFVEYAWEQSPESADFTSDRWQDFNEVRDRINSEGLYSIFANGYLNYELWPADYSPKSTFERKKSNCYGQALLGACFLHNNGFAHDVQTNESNVCCVLTIRWDRPTLAGLLGHSVLLFKKDKLFYYIDTSLSADFLGIRVGARGGIRGPYNSIKDVADDNAKRAHVKVASYQLE